MNNAPLFGIIIPGQPIWTDFVQVDPSGMKYTLTIRDFNLHQASSISDIVFVILPDQQQQCPIPPSHGAILYSQINGSSNSGGGFDLLGAVTSNRPSGIFKTNWNTHLSMNINNNSIDENSMMSMNNQNSSLSSTQLNRPVEITFGISIETVEQITNLEIEKKGVEDRVLDVAKKIATNLFNFLQSFDDVSIQNTRANNGMMTVPTNVFERWFARFQRKYEHDPNFFMKTED